MIIPISNFTQKESSSVLCHLFYYQLCIGLYISVPILETINLSVI